jgi:hypothetical protein
MMPKADTEATLEADSELHLVATSAEEDTTIAEDIIEEPTVDNHTHQTSH